jgi:hypothetical protein
LNNINNDIFYATIPIVNPLTVSAPVNVTKNSSPILFLGYPKIKLFGGTPYIVYQTTSPTSGLYLSQMSTPINVAGSQATASNVSLGIDNSGNSYVAWNPAQNGSDVYFNMLPAGSTLFKFNSPAPNLSNKPSTYGPAIALDSSQYVYVAFFSRPAYQSTYDVFLTRTTNGGSIFTDAFDISNTLGDSFSYAPGIAITNKTGYIVWDDNSYTLNHSTNQILLQKILLD